MGKEMTKTGDPNARSINLGTRIVRRLALHPWRGTYITRTHAVLLPGEVLEQPPSPPPLPPEEPTP